MIRSKYEEVVGTRKRGAVTAILQTPAILTRIKMSPRE